MPTKYFRLLTGLMWIVVGLLNVMGAVQTHETVPRVLYIVAAALSALVSGTNLAPRDT